MFQHQPKKRFGQNFLTDDSIIYQIIDLIHPQPNDNLLEIGPGKGALTFPILKKTKKLCAIEIDRDLINNLKQRITPEQTLQIINQDALKYDLEQLPIDKPLRIFGNLPYNISTPLIFHLLDQGELIQDMHFMLQLEVANRIAAGPGTKAYGKLSIMVQYLCEVELLLTIKPTAFTPAPKVMSAIIRLTPKSLQKNNSTDVKQLNRLVTNAFSKRRKTLANALKNMVTIDLLEQLKIDPSKRPEQISIDDYVKLSNTIKNAPRE